jgi:chemotaxis protein CheX
MEGRSRIAGRRTQTRASLPRTVWRRLDFSGLAGTKDHQRGFDARALAALIAIKGDIEGRIILDLSPEVAIKIASQLSGAEVTASEQVVRETVCEMANMVIGNSVTLLNDQGFKFKVFPPEIHVNTEGLGGDAETEAMVLCIETLCGQAYLNIAMHYLHRRRNERDAVPALD